MRPPPVAYKHAPSHAFPRGRRLVSVEYPGFVRDTERAFATLGGKERVGKVAAGTADTLELRYRPEDLFAHPIVGDAIGTANLLLKVTRRRRRAAPGRPAGEWEERSEVVGTIARTVRFRAMADFQYTPDLSWNTTQLRHALQDLDVDAIARLSALSDDVPGSSQMRNIPPPIFSRVDVPQVYGFRQNPAVVKVPNESGEGYRLVNKQKMARLVAHVLDLKSPTVPTEPPAQAGRDAQVLPQDQVALVRKLFERRPIWSRLGVLNSLPPEARKHIKKLLPIAAYFVSSGPFREAWVRYGYDFRRDPASRAYQTFEVRFVKEARPLARAKRFIEGRAALGPQRGEGAPQPADPNSHLFDGVHQREMTVYQGVDLLEPKLKGMVESPEDVRGTYDPKDGWFSRAKLDAIREELRTQYLRLANRTDDRRKEGVAAKHAKKGEGRRGRKKKAQEEGSGSGSGEESPAPTKKKGKAAAKSKEKGAVTPSGRGQRGSQPQGVRPMAPGELNERVESLLRSQNQGSAAESGTWMF
ncbi:RNA polymerase III transcription factor IIIC subunit-domain-containing protein [Hyaloraphidium curvatum]|nr:RNA polymerase III transcription factor IIIC subunit-domain-containing protein [Hyaloraphidium curvatum]